MLTQKIMEDDDAYFDDVDERDQHLYRRTASTESAPTEGDTEERTPARAAGDDSANESDPTQSDRNGTKSITSEAGGGTIQSGQDGMTPVTSPAKERKGARRHHRSKSPSARGAGDAASRVTARADTHRTRARSRSRSPQQACDYSRLTYEEYLDRADTLIRARGPPAPFRPQNYQDIVGGGFYPPGPPMIGFPRPGGRRRRY